MERQVARQQIETAAAQGQPKGAEGNHAKLDVAPGEPPGQQRPQADAEGRDQKQVAALLLGQTMLLHPQGDPVDLGKGAEKHEVGRADNRQQQIAVPTQLPQGLLELLQGRRRGRCGGGRGGLSDPEAGGQPGQGDADTGESGAAVIAAAQLHQQRRQGRTENDRHVGEGFEQAVGAGEQAAVDQFRDHPVFGGAKQGALGRHQKQHPIETGVAAQAEGQHRQQGDAEFGPLHGQDDPGFAQAVGQGSRQRRKEQEGDHENRPGLGGNAGGLLGTVDRDQKEDDQQLEQVVVEGPETLSQVEPGERLRQRVRRCGHECLAYLSSNWWALVNT